MIAYFGQGTIQSKGKTIMPKQKQNKPLTPWEFFKAICFILFFWTSVIVLLIFWLPIVWAVLTMDIN